MKESAGQSSTRLRRLRAPLNILKKSGGVRIRVSYEKLNQICELSQLPILPVHQVPDALGSGGVFSLFDGAPRICKAEWRPLCYVLRFLVVNETSSSIRAPRRGRSRVLTAQGQGRRRKLSSKLSGFGRQAGPRNRSRPPKEYLGKRLPRTCLLYTSPSPRDRQKSRMPSSA